MRKDEEGNECPATLGEYLDLCTAFMPNSAAVELLENKIAESPNGRDEVVIAADSQMRYLLMHMLVQARKVPR